MLGHRTRLTGFLLLAMLLGACASGGKQTFVLHNSLDETVDVQFYSQSRDNTWPAPNDQYVLGDGETRTVTLTCQPQEVVCYGAWVSKRPATFWGTGPKNKTKCEDCCYDCSGGMNKIIDFEK